MLRLSAGPLIAAPSRNCALVQTDATVVISLTTTFAGGVAAKHGEKRQRRIVAAALVDRGDAALWRPDRGSRPVRASRPRRAKSCRRPPFSLAPVVWARRRSRPITSRSSPRPGRPRPEPARQCERLRPPCRLPDPAIRGPRAPAPSAPASFARQPSCPSPACAMRSAATGSFHSMPPITPRPSRGNCESRLAKPKPRTRSRPRTCFARRRAEEVQP